MLVLLVFLITLHTKHQEQSHLADSPTERNALIEVETSLIQEGSHGGQGTMWKIFINFKKTIMKLNNLSSQFASQFAETSLTSLVNSFNAQVGNRGFNSARAAYDDALIQEFIRRGIDVSVIHDGKTTSFAHKVKLDDTNVKLILA